MQFHKNLTFVSISLSSKSFIVHPAPLKSKAPQPNNAIILKLGTLPGSAANEIDLHNKLKILQRS